MSTQTTAGRFAPSVVDPADLSIIDAWDDDPEDGWMRPTIDSRAAVTARLAPEARDRGWARCTMCGAHLRYVCLAQHAPSGECIFVGEDCAENIDYAAGVDVKVSDLRARAADGRANAKAAAKAAAFLDDNPAFASALAALVDDDNDFGLSVSDYLQRKGTVTDGQYDGIVRAAERHAAHQARAAGRAAEEAANPPQAIPADVVTNRATITGVILGTKWVENAYGNTHKMLVRDDRGFKVFGAVPGGIGATNADIRGARVTFAARVTKSPEDDCFGFFTRPTKAALV